MLTALVNGQKSAPSPGLRGVCPGCGLFGGSIQRATREGRSAVQAGEPAQHLIRVSAACASAALWAAGYADASRGGRTARRRCSSDGSSVCGVSRSWKWHSDYYQGDNAAGAVRASGVRATPGLTDGARAYCSSGFATGVWDLLGPIGGRRTVNFCRIGCRGARGAACRIRPDCHTPRGYR